MAGISIIGMYDFYPAVFQDMMLPDGIDRDLVIDEILFRCAELELLYSSPIFLQHMIGHWFQANYDVFQKMYKTTVLDYNPIWNKDGTITEETTSTGNNTDIASVKGFNSDSWAQAGKNEGSAAGSSLTTRKESGNIGVTTTQQMIKEEREVSEFSIYTYIAERFRSTFCILIY